MNQLRAKSELLTTYLELLLNELLSEDILIFTPADPAQRGCQLSLYFKSIDVEIVHKELRAAGVICDVRKPDVMRVAPVPLYNTFTEVFEFVNILKAIIDKLR